MRPMLLNNISLKEDLTEKLRFSIAMELIDNFIESEYHRFFCDKDSLQKDELENLERAIRFYESQTGDIKGYAPDIAYAIEKIELNG